MPCITAANDFLAMSTIKRASTNSSRPKVFIFKSARINDSASNIVLYSETRDKTESMMSGDAWMMRTRIVSTVITIGINEKRKPNAQEAAHI